MYFRSALMYSVFLNGAASHLLRISSRVSTLAQMMTPRDLWHVHLWTRHHSLDSNPWPHEHKARALLQSLTLFFSYHHLTAPQTMTCRLQSLRLWLFISHPIFLILSLSHLLPLSLIHYLDKCHRRLRKCKNPYSTWCNIYNKHIHVTYMTSKQNMVIKDVKLWVNSCCSQQCTSIYGWTYTLSALLHLFCHLPFVILTTDNP